jgi:general secretion pathway protein G
MLQHRRGPRSNDVGFTLIELLIVIVILGVLAAVAIFAVGGINAKSKTAACTADVATVQTASDAYNALNGAYAADIPALVTANLLRAPAPADVNYTAATGAVVAKTGTAPC